MQAITVVATITAESGAEAIVGQALAAAVPQVRLEPGCEQYSLHADLEDPRTYVMVERWRSDADLEAHAKAPAFLQLAKAISGIATLSIRRMRPVV